MGFSFNRSSITAGVKTYTDMAAHNVTGTVAETDCGSVSLPAGVLGASGSLRVWIRGTKTGSAGNLTTRVYLGATQVGGYTTSAGAAVYPVIGIVYNTAANAQQAIWFWQDTASGAILRDGTAAEDTSAAKTFKYTIQLGNAADSWAGQGMFCEVIP